MCDSMTNASNSTQLNVNEDREPESAKALVSHLSLIISDQRGMHVTVKVKPTTTFTKIFNAYHTKTSTVDGQVKFLFDGNRIRHEQTPKELEMEDGDVIDCVQEQIGGLLIH